MRGRAEVKRWLEAALKDGWVRLPGDSAYSKNKKQKAQLGIQENFWIEKDGYKALVWFTKSSRSCSISNIHFPDLSMQESMYLGQDNGYDFQEIVRRSTWCAHCRKDKGKEKLKRFGSGNMCRACIKKIKEFARKNPTEERKYIGEAEVEFRHVRGVVAADKVKAYRILARLISPGSAFWEPYNGKVKEDAYTTSHAVQTTLWVAGYKVKYVEHHTDDGGNPVEEKKPCGRS